MKDILKVENDNNEKQKLNKKIKNKNGIIIGLAIATGILGLSTVGLGIGLGISQDNFNNSQTKLNSVYNNNFYSMLDSVNNLENRISKTLASNSSEYQRKTLLEASKNASETEIAVASLPLNQNDIEDTIKLVNQISGYTSVLAEKMVDGSSLSSQDKKTLAEIDDVLIRLKQQLSDLARRVERGYSLNDNENDSTGNSLFTKSLSITKGTDIDYPTMIYDGPFSDSVTNSEVKGLKGNKITKTEALKNLQKYFKNATEVKYEGETNGRFETYNFRVKNSDEEMLFAQVTMIGGNILTISGTGKDGESVIDDEKAKTIALEFAKENGISNGEVVWSDSIGNDIYLNIAPTQDGIILYPDLVKVKVNKTSSLVVGYDATTYWTNHVPRSLTKGSFSEKSARARVGSDYDIQSSRIVLSPLEYNREVVCVEIEAIKDGSTYYFYYNAQTGTLENVLKVIKTDNGNLLM